MNRGFGLRLDLLVLALARRVAPILASSRSVVWNTAFNLRTVFNSGGTSLNSSGLTCLISSGLPCFISPGVDLLDLLGVGLLDLLGLNLLNLLGVDFLDHLGVDLLDLPRADLLDVPSIQKNFINVFHLISFFEMVHQVSR